MRVFLDANILFSAANPKWLTRALLHALVDAGIELVASPYVWDEAERNVRRHFPQQAGELEQLRPWLVLADDGALPHGQMEFLPEKDRPVLAAAIRTGCSHLLTGDYQHFGSLMGTTFAGVKVVSQRLLADELWG